MANRLLATLAVITAGLLLLLTTASAETNVAATGTERNVPARIDAPAPAPASASATATATASASASVQELTSDSSRKQKKSVRRSAKKRRASPSEFVALSQRVLGNTFVLNHFAESGFRAYDPAIAERLLLAGESKWAYGQTTAQDAGANDQDGADGAFLRATIDIQGLDLEQGPFSPFFGNAFTPQPIGPSPLTADVISSGGELIDLASKPLHAAEAPLVEPGNSIPPIPVKTKGTPFAYRYKLDKMSVNAGVGWIHDLNDSYGTSRAFEEAGYVSSDKVSGLNLSLGASYQAFTLTGGYIRALDNQEAMQLSLAGNETEPVAWNSELAYATRVLRKETTLAVGYQKSSDSLQLYLPEERYSTKASMVLFDATTLSLEYYQDKDLSLKHGGENEGYGVTTQIGIGF